MLKFAHAMATAIGHIHDNGVLHRDIAPRNFVLSDGGLPVLIDFGLSRMVRGYVFLNLLELKTPYVQKGSM